MRVAASHSGLARRSQLPGPPSAPRRRIRRCCGPKGRRRLLRRDRPPGRLRGWQTSLHIAVQCWAGRRSSPAQGIAVRTRPGLTASRQAILTQREQPDRNSPPATLITPVTRSPAGSCMDGPVITRIRNGCDFDTGRTGPGGAANRLNRLQNGKLPLVVGRPRTRPTAKRRHPPPE